MAKQYMVPDMERMIRELSDRGRAMAGALKHSWGTKTRNIYIKKARRGKMSKRQYSEGSNAAERYN